MSKLWDIEGEKVVGHVYTAYTMYILYILMYMYNNNNNLFTWLCFDTNTFYKETVMMRSVGVLSDTMGTDLTVVCKNRVPTMYAISSYLRIKSCCYCGVSHVVVLVKDWESQQKMNLSQCNPQLKGYINNIYM